VAPVIWAAKVKAATLGGRFSLRRHGFAVVKAPSTTLSRAARWSSDRTTAWAPSGARRWCATIWPVPMITSMSGKPTRSRTVTSRPTMPGGTEYQLPRNATRAEAETRRATVIVAGYGVAGSRRSDSRSAASPVVGPCRGSWSAVVEQKCSKERCASSGVVTAAVRHQRWVVKWIFFSTAPLRFARRGGQMTTSAP